MKKNLEHYRTRNIRNSVLKVKAKGTGIEYSYVTNVTDEFTEFTDDAIETLVTEWVERLGEGKMEHTWELEHNIPNADNHTL